MEAIKPSPYLHHRHITFGHPSSSVSLDAVHSTAGGGQYVRLATTMDPESTIMGQLC